MKLKNKYNYYDNIKNTDAAINSLKEMIENINNDISLIDTVMETHLKDYKNNCDLNHNEIAKINKRIDSSLDYIKAVNLNNKLLKAAIEYYSLKSEISFLLLNNEISKIESLPWYKRIFKKYRAIALSEAINEIMDKNKDKLSKAKTNFDNVIKELESEIKEN